MFRSYDGTDQGYSKVVNAQEHMVPSTSELVYQHDINDDVNLLFTSLEKNVSTYFMHEFRDVWSEAQGNNDENSGNFSEFDFTEDENEPQATDLDMSGFGGDDDGSISSIVPDPDSSSDAGHLPDQTLNSDSDNPQSLNNVSGGDSLMGVSNHHLNRSWNSWGTIHRENVLPQRRHARFGRGRRDRTEPGWEDILRAIERKENQNG